MLDRWGQVSARAKLWLRRKQDYDACFKGPVELSMAGAAVMRDIGQFCGAYKSTVTKDLSGAVDPIAMAMAEGRRQVYLHIQRRLRLTDAQILDAMEEAHD